MSQFNEKVALVTGGGTGIGKAVTEALVAGGAKVVVVGRRSEPLDVLATEHPGSVAAFAADLGKPGSAKEAVAFAVKTFGRLDVLVNNAGVGIIKPLTDTTEEDLDLLLSVNVKAVLSTTREALPELVKRKGNVVNVSSVVSTGVFPGSAAYSGTKAAVDQITRALAAELGPQGVRVNAVAPGMTETPMTAGMGEDKAMMNMVVAQTPLGRLGDTRDIASAVTYLASGGAQWVTGQILQSSGGFLL